MFWEHVDNTFFAWFGNSPIIMLVGRVFCLLLLVGWGIDIMRRLEKRKIDFSISNLKRGNTKNLIVALGPVLHFIVLMAVFSIPSVFEISSQSFLDTTLGGLTFFDDALGFRDVLDTRGYIDAIYVFFSCVAYVLIIKVVSLKFPKNEGFLMPIMGGLVISGCATIITSFGESIFPVKQFVLYLGGLSSLVAMLSIPCCFIGYTMKTARSSTIIYIRKSFVLGLLSLLFTLLFGRLFTVSNHSDLVTILIVLSIILIYIITNAIVREFFADSINEWLGELPLPAKLKDIYEKLFEPYSPEESP